MWNYIGYKAYMEDSLSYLDNLLFKTKLNEQRKNTRNKSRTTKYDGKERGKVTICQQTSGF